MTAIGPAHISSRSIRIVAPMSHTMLYMVLAMRQSFFGWKCLRHGGLTRQLKGVLMRA